MTGRPSVFDAPIACAACGEPIYRRRLPSGRLMARDVFLRQQYCSRECMARGFQDKAGRICAVCGRNISVRGITAKFCVECAEDRERERDKIQRRERYAAEQRRKYGKPALNDVIAAAAEAHCAPRDPALEAKIAAHLADIRASRRFKVEDIVWARRVDPVAAEAQDLAGASLCLATETRTHRERRAKRFAEAERRAVATEVEHG